MTLTLDDYLNPDKFPVTSREGLSVQQQFRIDAFNYDNLVRYKAEGNKLSERQVAILKELEVKVPAQKDLRDALRYLKMPTVNENRSDLENQGIMIRGELAKRLRAKHYNCLVKLLSEEPDFREALKIIIDERNERAETNLRVVRENTGIVSRLQTTIRNYNIRIEELEEKLQEFININNSEILKAGKWLLKTLSLSGQEQNQALLERNLVHRESYNEAVSEMKETIETIDAINEITVLEAGTKIKFLQQQLDSRNKQLGSIEKYISENFGISHWKSIKNQFNITQEDDYAD